MTKLVKRLLVGIMGLTASVGVAVKLGNNYTSRVANAADTLNDGLAEFTLEDTSAVTVDNVTVSFADGGGTTPYWGANGLRLYTKNTVTVSSPNSITKIVFNWEKQGSKAFITDVTADVGTYSHPSSPGEGTWTGSSKSVVFTLNGTAQLQLNTLSVNYSASTEVVDVTGVVASPSTVSVGKGGTTQLTATVSPENATTKTVEWSSDDETIATVSSSGLVTGVATGSTVVTATTVDGGFTSDVTVTVTAPTDTLGLDGKQYYIYVPIESNKYYVDASAASSSAQPVATTSKESATPFKFTLVGPDTYEITSGTKYLYETSSNNGLRLGSTKDSWEIKDGTKGTENGLGFWGKNNSRQITYYAAGNDFRSYTNDTNRTADLLLEEYVALPDSISLDPTSLTIEAGQVGHIDATSTGSDVVWSVTAGTDKVEIKNGDNKGVDVKGLAAGSATVTATVGTKTATCEVTVNAAQELTFNKVTSNLDDFSGTYLLVCESKNVAFDGSLSTVEVASNNVPVTISNSSITGTFTHNVVTIAKVDGGYSIQTASGVYIGHTGTSNSLNQSEEPMVCTISVEDGNAIISSGDYTLRYNGASNQNRFRFYTSGQTAVQLYRLSVDCSEAVQDFVDTYMHMSDDAYNGNGTGLCKSEGTYNAAKAALLALGTDAINEFQNNSDFDAAQARYEAWALANNDAAPYSQASSSGRHILLGTSASSMSAIIVVSVIVGVAAVGLLLLKKRKATK